MLDPRLYRAAFAPILLALVVAAFSLVDRPAALRATVAPDAFNGPRAFQTLRGLATSFPDRAPGSDGDSRLADKVATELRRTFCESAEDQCDAVSVRTPNGRTIDGERELKTVVATRLGAPGPGIVVVSHRDADGAPSEGELSATAALIELSRVFRGRRTTRTLTMVSASGGTGGHAGVKELLDELPEGNRNPAAVVVLGDMASVDTRRPWVLPWSTGPELAPVELRRTAETALRAEAGGDPGQPRGIAQLARLAFPFALREEGRFNAAGFPAVTISATGERGAEPGAAVSEQRMAGFGRAALRTIVAVDGEDTVPAPSAEVVILSKVLPPWVVRLLVGVLLLPMLVAAIDGLARVRRRKAPVALWLRWLAWLALPFVAALLVARLLGATGLIDDAPAGAVAAGRVPADAVALATVLLVFVLAAIAVRPLQRLFGARPEDAPAVEREAGGPAAALTLVITGLALAVWVVNPFAAGILVLPAHLWMLASVPEVRLGRAAALLLVLVALAPAALVLAVFASATGASIVQLPWLLVLLVAGGSVGVLSLLVLCALGACALGAFRLALLPAAGESPPSPAESIRGPMGYAGPGSLGGTESGFGSGMRR